MCDDGYFYFVVVSDYYVYSDCIFCHFYIIMIMIGRVSRLRCWFGTEGLNLRVCEKDPVSGEKLDGHLNRYGHLFRAFVVKRRLVRSEIWPKIHILEDEVDEREKPHLKYQQLYKMKK